jgi:hypothetical protein
MAIKKEITSAGGQFGVNLWCKITIERRWVKEI